GKCIDRSLDDGDVLLDGSGACADGADDLSVDDNRNTATEDDDLPVVRLLDAVQRLTGLRELGEQGRRLVEDARGSGLVDGQVDAAYQRAVLAHEGEQVASTVDDGDVVRDSECRRLRFGRGEHELRVVERQGLAGPWHLHPRGGHSNSAAMQTG